MKSLLKEALPGKRGYHAQAELAPKPFRTLCISLLITWLALVFMYLGGAIAFFGGVFLLLFSPLILSLYLRITPWQGPETLFFSVLGGLLFSVFWILGLGLAVAILGDWVGSTDWWQALPKAVQRGMYVCTFLCTIAFLWSRYVRASFYEFEHITLPQTRHRLLITLGLGGIVFALSALLMSQWFMYLEGQIVVDVTTDDDSQMKQSKLRRFMNLQLHWLYFWGWAAFQINLFKHRLH